MSAIVSSVEPNLLLSGSEVIDVIIPTYNPDRLVLNQVLSSAVKYSPHNIELRFIIVDNNSAPRLDSSDLSVPGAVIEIVRERKPGTAFARIAGLKKVTSSKVLYLDDDNVLTADYIAEGVRFLENRPMVAAVGGKIELVLEPNLPRYLLGNESLLAMRNFGEIDCVSTFDTRRPSYPFMTPLTAGLLFRKSVVDSFLAWVALQDEIISGRIGTAKLGASEDCEFLMQGVYLDGMQSGYCAKMVLQHIIPHQRVSWSNMKKTAYEGGFAWGKFLLKYGFQTQQARPLSILRSLKQSIKMKAWSKAGYLKWLHYSGMQFSFATKK